MKTLRIIMLIKRILKKYNVPYQEDVVFDRVGYNGIHYLFDFAFLVGTEDCPLFYIDYLLKESLLEYSEDFRTAKTIYADMTKNVCRVTGERILLISEEMSLKTIEGLIRKALFYAASNIKFDARKN